MKLELAYAKIKVLEENNAKLSALVSHLLSQPTQATVEYQQLLATAKKEADKASEKPAPVKK